MLLKKLQYFPSNFIPELIIYHNVTLDFPCPDGLAATAIAKKKFSKTDCLGWTYGQCDENEFPPLDNYQNILVLDFSFPIKFLDIQEKLGKRIIIIDHHDGFERKIKSAKTYNLSNFFFDSEECGASLTWKLLFPDQKQPEFLKYIRDRDLFRNEISYSEEFHAGSGYLGRNFNLYDLFFENEKIDPDLNLTLLRTLAQKTLPKKHEKIRKYLSKVEFWNNIPVSVLVKSDIYLKSDVADWICKFYPFVKYCVILNKSDNTHIRLKSCYHTSNLNLLEKFEKYIEVVGHKTAISFKWYQGLEKLQEFLISVQG